MGYVIKNVRKFLFVLFLFNSFFLFGIDYSDIKELSYFRTMGTVDLRKEPSFDSEVIYRTLNHEGGMKVRVLEIGKEDLYKNHKGKWFYVLLVAPMWVDNGEWIEKHNKFWIYIYDEIKIYNYEQ